MEEAIRITDFLNVFVNLAIVLVVVVGVSLLLKRYHAFIGFRFLRSRLTNFLAIGAVAFGVMVLIVVLSVMWGFDRMFRQRLQGTLAPIIVEGAGGLRLSDYPETIKKIESVPGVTRCSPHVDIMTLYSFVRPTSQVSGYVMVRGIDPAREKVVGEIEAYVRAGNKGTADFLLAGEETDDVGVIVGEALYKTLRKDPFGLQGLLQDLGAIAARKEVPADVRERLKQLAAHLKKNSEDIPESLGRLPFDLKQWLADLQQLAEREQTPSDLRAALRTIPFELKRLRRDIRGQMIEIKARSLTGAMLGDDRYLVLGSFRTGMYQYDAHWVYMPLEAAQDLAGYADPGEVSSISVGIQDPDRLEEVKARVEAALNPAEESSLHHYKVQTWKEKQGRLLTALYLERRALGIILALMAVLAAFTIMAVMLMTVREKTRDIGILKALGATARGIMAIFLWNGLLIGIIGSILGLFAGLGILCNLSSILSGLERLTGFAFFSKDVFYLERMPAHINETSITTIVVAAILCSLAIAIYPSARAGASDPVRSLRYE